MIDEKSLRLGSYVMYENTTHVVEELRGRNNTIVTRWIKGADHYIHTADELDPIPLTEEMLLRCGFEKKETQYGFPHYFHPNLGFNYFIEHAFDSYTLRYRYRDDGFSHSIKSFTHLHQLQNLIYCLSGKELEVKL